MSIEKIIHFIADLVNKGFTGRIILDFHNGSISSKVKREITELLE
jgi:hypothetical protein